MLTLYSGETAKGVDDFILDAEEHSAPEHCIIIAAVSKLPVLSPDESSCFIS
jgi:hypothetical protein